MRTLQQAIASRLEEKRQAEAEAERRARERKAEITKAEAVCTRLFREWLKSEYQFEPDGLVIRAEYVGSIAFAIRLETPNAGRIGLTDNLHCDGAEVWQTRSRSHQWQAAKYDSDDQYFYVGFDNFIDAYIHAAQINPDVIEFEQDKAEFGYLVEGGSLTPLDKEAWKGLVSQVRQAQTTK